MQILWVSAGIELTETAEEKATCLELDRLRHHTISEPGCLYFEIFRDQENPKRFTLWECWTGQEALDAHFQEPHTLDYLAKDLTRVVYVEKLTKLKMAGEKTS